MEPYFEYVRGHPDANNNTRLLPRPSALLISLILAFASACERMPRLKVAMLATSVRRCIRIQPISGVEEYADADWGIYYAGLTWSAPFFVGTPNGPTYGREKLIFRGLLESPDLLSMHRLYMGTHTWWPNAEFRVRLQRIRGENTLVQVLYKHWDVNLPLTRGQIPLDYMP
jgi:hypothetical protein